MAEKDSKIIAKGKVYIQATFNNTLVSFTDMEGNVFAWGACGVSGFKGTRKATPYAATVTIEAAAKKAVAKGLKEVEVYIKGPGVGRDAALKVLKSQRLKMNLIADVTPIPHNGPRPRKKRRV